MKSSGVILFLILASVANIWAGMRPSFSLDYSSWKATHIAIAGEGDEIDGNFTVSESLKGDLGAGETVFLEPLGAFRDETARRVKHWDYQDIKPFKQVTGARVILFLNKNPDSKQIWEPATLWKDFKVSLVWIEGSGTFAFLQVANPGASILVEYEKTEAEIKSRIFEITELRNSFAGVLRIENKAERAAALERFAVSDFFLARLDAFEALEKCGQSALPVLRKMLRDESLLKIHPRIIEALGAVGGAQVGDELTEIVGRETSFWRRTAPVLETGWWNKMDDPEMENRRSRYSKVLEAIRQLKKLEYRNSRKIVVQFRDFWRSQPPLSELEQMIRETDELLRVLESK